MRFGFMDHVPCAAWQSEGQRYRDILAQIEVGDKVGFDTAWLAEIHFFPDVSRLASPLTVLAAAAQRTQRIRLGTAVTLLPLHNPLADTLGTLLAVPFARLFAGLLAILACVAFVRQNGGVGVVLIILVGMILIGPAIMRLILSRVLLTGAMGG